MEFLRRARHLPRFVLVWFALYLGVAMASPLIQPQGMALMCSGSGLAKLAASHDDGSAPVSGHTLDCPLCAGISAPPPLLVFAFKPVEPLGHVPQRVATDTISRAISAPMPARGPPVLL